MTILALVLLYKIESIERFPMVQDFDSYCRLVKCIQMHQRIKRQKIR